MTNLVYCALPLHDFFCCAPISLPLNGIAPCFVRDTRILGLNFGPDSPQSFVDGVWLMLGTNRLPMVGCVFVSPHRGLECQTPTGTGLGLRLQVSVLGQASGVSLDTLSYSPPQVAAVTPASVPTEGAFVSITGFNFGVDMANTSVQLSTGAELRDVAFVVPHRTLRVSIPYAAIAGVSTFSLLVKAGTQVGWCL